MTTQTVNEGRSTGAGGAPWFADVLRCTSCNATGSMDFQPDQVLCKACGLTWPILDNIPAFAGEPAKDTPKAERNKHIEAQVRHFYEKNPFPTYDDFDSIGSLVEKARKGLYAQYLDDQIPSGIRVLECGCGTGQLSTFLSIANRQCLGVDMCMASLRCGDGFRQKQELQRLNFIQGNIFNLPIAEESFDLVISKGVLHHTPDCHKAFHEVAKRVKKGGYLIIGLYNLYGRVPTHLRRALYRVVPPLRRRGDFVMRKVIQSAEKRRIWWEDQYNNPHETSHSVDQLLKWFDEAGIEYVNAFPPIRFGGTTKAPKLFKPEAKGGKLEHILVQMGWMFSIGREGALFDIIGRKPG
jgi:ubiquinone/menaquinone biosynthesis C-methylase UbiE